MLDIQEMLTEDLVPYVNNPRHNDHAVDAVANSIDKFGFKVPIVVDRANEVIAGHTRLKAAKQLGLETVPVIVADDLSEDQVRAFRLADNKVGELAEWDEEILLAELDKIDLDMEQFGFDEIFNELEEDYVTDRIGDDYAEPLIDTFVVPPMSVLDSRQGYWQDRKREWKSIGLASEEGRDDGLTYGSNLNIQGTGETSVFDPVLCESMYRWFAPDGIKARIIDCFAGGSVRGVVAERLGHEYLGIDLSSKQIEANNKQAELIGCNLNNINWIVDNSKNVDDHAEDDSFDLMLTCPPYFDLEKYSENPDDLSNLDYETFIEDYSEILIKTANKVKNNRFAVVVISNVRDKRGLLRDLISLTTQSMSEAGFNLYNNAVLIRQIGSGALRARKQMESRKLVSTHDNILVYYKGDTKNIKEELGVLDNINYEIEQ